MVYNSAMHNADIFEGLKSIPGPGVILYPIELGQAREIFQAIEESRAELLRTMPWENRNVGDVKNFIRATIEKRRAGAALHLAIYAEWASGPNFQPGQIAGNPSESGIQSRKNLGPDAQATTFAGIIGLHKFDPYTPRGEVGYWVRTSLHGRGLAGAALAAVIAWSAETLGLARLDAQTWDQNIPSQRVLEKNGFQKEGFQPKGELCHGIWHDMILWGKLL